MSFHKREGQWRPPTACTRCAADPTWAQQAADARESIRRKKEAKKDNRRKPSLLKGLEAKGAFPTVLDQITLSSELTWWDNTFTDYAKEGRQSLYVHIVARHGDKIVEQIGLGKDQEVIEYLSMLAGSEDSSRFVQFRQGDTAVVKLDVMTRITMIVDMRSPQSPKPITAFPPDTDGYILSKLDRGQWEA